MKGVRGMTKITSVSVSQHKVFVYNFLTFGLLIGLLLYCAIVPLFELSLRAGALLCVGSACLVALVLSWDRARAFFQIDDSEQDYIDYLEHNALSSLGRRLMWVGPVNIGLILLVLSLNP